MCFEKIWQKSFLFQENYAFSFQQIHEFSLRENYEFSSQEKCALYICKNCCSFLHPDMKYAFCVCGLSLLMIRRFHPKLKTQMNTEIWIFIAYLLSAIHKSYLENRQARAPFPVGSSTPKCIIALYDHSLSRSAQLSNRYDCLLLNSS